MKKLMGMTAALSLIVGCADTSAPTTDANGSDQDPAAPDTATLAVLTPEGWGPLRIGMSRVEVTAAVGDAGHPDGSGMPDPEMCDEFPPERAPAGFYVMIEEDVLTRISIGEGTDIETAEGLSIGGTADAVRAAYGDQLESEPHHYIGLPGEYLTVWTVGESSENGMSDENARGIRYETDMDGRIQSIHAGGPSIQYVEGCL